MTFHQITFNPDVETDGTIQPPSCYPVYVEIENDSL